jgi:hypothetical protein
MSKEITLESVKAAGAATIGDSDKYNDVVRMDARRAWWSHCEAVQLNVPRMPTFREFWNDENTYQFVA